MKLQNAIFLLLSLYPLFIFSSSSSQITPGSSLSSSNLNLTWKSPNSTFYLGFIQLGSTSYAAAVYYSGGVPIWTAGGSFMVLDSTASFNFTSTGTLQLIDASSSVIWDSNTAHLGVTSATLDDSGNLVLRNRTGGSVWSTFQNPTDTIVPDQNFTANQVLKSGFYSFHLLDSGNVTLTWNDSIVYWNQGLNSSVRANLSKPVLGLEPIGIMVISDFALTRPSIVAYSSDYAEGSDILRFLKLDSDGNFRIYSSGLKSGTSTVRWAAMADQCQVYGYCGNFGVCSYNESNSNPICRCPSQNFEPLDVSDSRKGCKRKVEIETCQGTATMLEMEHSMFLTFEQQIATQVFWVGISACRLNCLISSSCVASTSLSDGTGMCYLKSREFVSGYQNPALPSTSYVKVCGPVQPYDSSDLLTAGNRKSRMHFWVVCVVVLVTLLGLVALEGGLWWWCCRNSPKFSALSAQYALLEYASGAPVQFSYKDLHRTTKGFKEKLGAGGFGAVYKGILANRTAVAVKRLEGIEQGEKQFRMEVATISSTHHLNLVRLIGFCSEGRHRLLVYEFMKHGSLDHFLFSAEDQSAKLLNWQQRFSIAIGTARGITYLHEECRDCIVHCDIKPENILLDENYNAKVSDFGLAKLVNPKDHRSITLKSVRGTRGYLAPEWLANLPITSKSDVYSYGMVLLEIVSGRRNYEVSEGTERKKFTVWAYEEFEKGNVNAIIDKRLGKQDVNMEQVKRAIEVSFWCIQEQPSHRPMIGKVVQMLEGILEIEKPPAPKVFTEVSINSTSMNMSSNASILSTFAASASAATPSSFSSYQTIGVSPLPSGRNLDKPSSSLLVSSEPK
ncbi:G-type lectin S-receptor-like serine/threonine-protein kinase At1g34300 [Euphorbia peplus]|nr:G-type lectin S-receptor-like serine/threonine-protein kinase At1g34300 [Euphorbia peplus]